MSRLDYSWLVLPAGILAFVSCRRSEPNYCPTAHDQNCMELDARNTCGSDTDCSGATAVCDVNGTKTCVQCTSAEAGACAGTTPVCGTDNACQRCTDHAQCSASDVCLPSGACADATDVAYVDPMTSNASPMCTKTAPCSTIAEALTTGKPYVKLHGTADEHVIIDIPGKVTFLADPGAKLTRTSNGLLLEIRGSSQVEIYDLEITGASGMNNPGISLPPGNTATLTLTRAVVSNNTGGGILANGGMLTVNQSTISGNTGVGISTSGSTLTVTGSTLSGNPGGGMSTSGGTLTVNQSNISGNPGGGISVSGGTLTVNQCTVSGNTGGGISITGSQYQLINNFIVKNGGPMSAFGGVQISQIALSGTHVFEFNTTTGNVATGTNTAGVVCSLVGSPLTFTNSIAFQNNSPSQVEGANCTWTYSDIGPAAVTGAGNINADPMFVDTTKNDFHLMPGSPARRAADPSTDLTGLASHDIDGDPRASPADMGADQVK